MTRPEPRDADPPDPAAGSRASAYAERVLALLGDADPLAVQGELVSELRALVDGLDEAALRRPEASGKWSIHQVIEHLVDAEIAHALRYRLALTEHEPSLPGYDQEAWTARLHYEDGDVASALAQLDALRARNLRLSAALGPAERARAGVHGERGRETVVRMTAMAAGHDLAHRRQVERIRAGLLGG